MLFWKFGIFLNAKVLWFYFRWVEFGECGVSWSCDLILFDVSDVCVACGWGLKELLLRMDDLAGLVEATGSRFTSLELIGQGSFGDVYKG